MEIVGFSHGGLLYLICNTFILHVKYYFLKKLRRFRIYLSHEDIIVTHTGTWTVCGLAMII